MSRTNDISPATGNRIRAARMLLGWRRVDLAAASRVPMRTLARLEEGRGTPRASTIGAVVAALEAAGIVMTPHGLELRD